jgi:hypothetical protein
VTSAIAAKLGHDPATAAATPELTAGAFKATVKLAVLQTAMKQLTARHTSAKGRSTVANYLAILGPEGQEFPNTLPHYLNTAMHRGAQLKMLYRAGFAPVAHTASKKHKTSPACVFCGGCDDETATHFSLECPAFNSQRQPLLDDLTTLVGPAKYSAWAALSGGERLNALLGDKWWGDRAAGNEWTQSYLLQLEGARKQLAAPNVGSGSICTETASDGARAHGFGYG